MKHILFNLIRHSLAQLAPILYNSPPMVVIRGAAHDAEHDRKIRQVKHVLADVLTDTLPSETHEFHAYSSKPKSVIRGIYTRPTKTISLGKVKQIIPVDPMHAFTRPSSISLSSESPVHPMYSAPSSIPPVDPSLYEDDVAVYRAQAERQVDIEMGSYREQVMAAIEREKKETLARAFQEGVAKAQKQAEADYQRDAQDLFKAINSVQDQRYLIVEREQQDLIDLSLKIAGAVIEREIEVDPNIIFNIVKKTLEKVTDTDKVIIKVHPDSVSIVREHQNDLLALMPDIRQLHIQGDERIHRGGCLIETKLGFVDASVATKLETIRQALLGATGG